MVLILAACAPAQPEAPTPGVPATTETNAAKPTPIGEAVSAAVTAAVPRTPSAGGASATQKPGPLPANTIAKLDEFLKAQVYSKGADPKTHTPGLVLLVDTPNGRYLQAGGVTSLEKGTPMQVDSRLEIGRAHVCTPVTVASRMPSSA